MSGEEALELYRGGKLTRIKIRIDEELGIDLGEHWVDGLYQLQFDAYRRELQLIPGIVEVLDALDLAGVPSCVGSHGPLYKMRVLLGVTGLYVQLAGRTFSANIVADQKPATGLFLVAAAPLYIPP